MPLQVLPAHERVRIVEVGSGSGGTSAVVMAALAHLEARVEFVYTDISPQLVAYGRKTYGPRYPFVRFRALDVERDVAPQVTCRQIRLPNLLTSTCMNPAGAALAGETMLSARPWRAVHVMPLLGCKCHVGGVI